MTGSTSSDGTDLAANKPHIRRASVDLEPAPFRGTPAEQLPGLISSWGIPDPERYGLPLPPPRPAAPPPAPVVARSLVRPS